MANPQKEKGNVGIANEIFDALCHIRIPGEARQVLDVIFRQTYGWQKKKDGIALKTFCAKTGIDKGNICRAIKILQNMRIIIVEKDNESWNIYRVNKDFTQWKPLSKKTTLSKTTMIVVENDNLALSKTTPSINNYSKNNISTPPMAAEIEKKLKKFLSQFEKIKNPSAYALSLIKKYPAAAIEKALANNNCISPSKLSSLIEDYSTKKSSAPRPEMNICIKCNNFATYKLDKICEECSQTVQN